MPVSNALSAYNTLLKIGDGGGPEVFTTVAEIFNLTGPGLVGEPIDITHMESPGRFREHLVGLLDATEASWDMNWIPDNSIHAGLITDYKARTKRNFEVIWSDTAGTKWSFTASIISFEPGASVEDKLLVSVTVKISGEPTLI